MPLKRPAASVRRIRSGGLLKPIGLSSDATLLLRNLLRLALKVRRFPLPRISAAAPHLLFKTTELFCRALAASRR